MTQAQHTPGPWYFRPDDIMASSGQGVYCTSPDWPHALAIVKPAPAPDYKASCAEANLRLIAAAPDLLAALETASEWLALITEPAELNEWDRGQMESFSAAIAKARGDA